MNEINKMSQITNAKKAKQEFQVFKNLLRQYKEQINLTEVMEELVKKCQHPAFLLM